MYYKIFVDVKAMLVFRYWYIFILFGNVFNVTFQISHVGEIV